MIVGAARGPAAAAPAPAKTPHLVSRSRPSERDRRPPMDSCTAVITGTGRSVPSTVVTNHDLEKRVDTSDEWIRTRTGIRERRIASEGEGVSLYAGEAGRHCDGAESDGVGALHPVCGR